jgi:hypothetical protein
VGSRPDEVNFSIYLTLLVSMTASVVWWLEFLVTDTESRFDSRRYQIF